MNNAVCIFWPGCVMHYFSKLSSDVGDISQLDLDYEHIEQDQFIHSCSSIPCFYEPLAIC